MGIDPGRNQLLRRACPNAARLLLKQKGTEGKVWEGSTLGKLIARITLVAGGTGDKNDSARKPCRLEMGRMRRCPLRKRLQLQNCKRDTAVLLVEFSTMIQAPHRLEKQGPSSRPQGGTIPPERLGPHRQVMSR